MKTRLEEAVDVEAVDDPSLRHTEHSDEEAPWKKGDLLSRNGNKHPYFEYICSDEGKVWVRNASTGADSLCYLHDFRKVSSPGTA
jgi:hypothetical protein